MRKFITTLLFALTLSVTYGQYSPDGKNWKHYGDNWFTRAINVMGSLLTGEKIAGYDATKAKVDEAVDASTILISKSDSIYPKPGSYTSLYDFKNESLLPLWIRTLKGLGLNIKGTSVAMEFAQPVSNGNMVDGQIHWELVQVRDSVTISSVTFMLVTAGTSTFDAYNGIGIYSISGSTATKLTETANSSTIWTSGANVSNTVNLPAPILLVPGTYYFAFCTNWSTAGTVPVIYQANYGMWASKASFTNGLLISGKTTSQAALPASVSIGTFSSDNYGYGLYY